MNIYNDHQKARNLRAPTFERQREDLFETFESEIEGLINESNLTIVKMVQKNNERETMLHFRK